MSRTRFPFAAYSTYWDRSMFMWIWRTASRRRLTRRLASLLLGSSDSLVQSRIRECGIGGKAREAVPIGQRSTIALETAIHRHACPAGRVEDTRDAGKLDRVTVDRTRNVPIEEAALGYADAAVMDEDQRRTAGREKTQGQTQATKTLRPVDQDNIALPHLRRQDAGGIAEAQIDALPAAQPFVGHGHVGRAGIVLEADDRDGGKQHRQQQRALAARAPGLQHAARRDPLRAQVQKEHLGKQHALALVGNARDPRLEIAKLPCRVGADARRVECHRDGSGENETGGASRRKTASIPVSMVSRPNCFGARSRAAPPTRAASAGSSSSRRSASASAGASLGGTTRPVTPSVPASPMLPTEVVTTGRPVNIAWSSACGTPSLA